MKKLLIYIFTMFLFVACKANFVLSMKDFNNSEVIDLNKLCEKEYDFLIILDEGNYLFQLDLKKYGIEDFNEEQQWLGEKIFFIHNNKIIKQVNIDYYVSEPKANYRYISFFLGEENIEGFIYRDYENSIFHRKFVQNLKNNSFCYYFE